MAAENVTATFASGFCFKNADQTLFDLLTNFAKLRVFFVRPQITKRLIFHSIKAALPLFWLVFQQPAHFQ